VVPVQVLGRRTAGRPASSALSVSAFLPVWVLGPVCWRSWQKTTTALVLLLLGVRDSSWLRWVPRQSLDAWQQLLELLKQKDVQNRQIDVIYINY
jgi:hypothetical protein